MVEARPQRMDSEYPYEAEDTRAEDSHQRRLQRVAQTAHGRRWNLIECRYPLGCHGDGNTYLSVVGHCGVGGKECEKVIFADEQRHIARKGEQSPANKTDAEYALAPFHVAGAIVLPHERHAGTTEGVEKEVAVGIENL